MLPAPAREKRDIADWISATDFDVVGSFDVDALAPTYASGIVIPAKAGIQGRCSSGIEPAPAKSQSPWIPAFAGMTSLMVFPIPDRQSPPLQGCTTVMLAGSDLPIPRRSGRYMSSTSGGGTV